MKRNEREANRKQAKKSEDVGRSRMVGVEPDRDRGLSGGLALGTTLLVAGLAAAFLAFGCGRQDATTVATNEGTAVSAAAETPPASTASTAVPAAATSAPVADVAEATPEAGGTEVQGLHMDTVSSDALPPAVEATVPDGMIAPGSIVEIRAEGSPDVVTMTLRDGAGKEQSFARDEASGDWTTLYRAPLKAGTEPVALSVTAKNAGERWRRVWVFLSVGREVAAADSSGQ